MYPAGSKDVPLGKVLAILVEEEEDIAAFKDYKPEDTPAPAAPAKAAEPAAATPAAAAPKAAAAAPAAPAKASGDRIFASPLAQNMANSSGVNLAGVAGTGPGGRIIKADI